MYFAVFSFKMRLPHCVNSDIVECQSSIPIRIVELLSSALVLVAPFAAVPNSEPKTPSHHTMAMGLEMFTKYPTSSGFR